MIVTMFKIPIAQGREQEFEESFKARKGAVDGMKGFVTMAVLKPMEGNEHIVMSAWESKDDFDVWTKSEQFAQAHGRSHPGMASGRPVLAFYDVITCSESFGVV